MDPKFSNTILNIFYVDKIKINNIDGHQSFFHLLNLIDYNQNYNQDNQKHEKQNNMYSDNSGSSSYCCFSKKLI